MKKVFSVSVILTFLFALNISAAMARSSTVVFSTDFESGVPLEFSGAGNDEDTQNYSSHGFGRWFLRNASTGNPAAPIILTLTNLPEHNKISLGFLLAIIDSWDGNTTRGGSIPPDYLNVTVDDTSIFKKTFDNYDFSDQSYTGTPITWGTNLGFSGGPASAYNMSFPLIPHSADTLTIKWFASGSGWQGGTDESFAIDNVNVTLINASVDIDQIFSNDSNNAWDIVFSPNDVMVVNEGIVIRGDAGELYTLAVKYFFIDSENNKTLLGNQKYRRVGPGKHYVSLETRIPSNAAAGKGIIRNTAFIKQRGVLLDNTKLQGYIHIEVPE